MTRLVEELIGRGFPAAAACRVLGVPRSTFYDHDTRSAPARRIADEALLPLIAKAHADSRGTYGTPRVHAELALGVGVRIGRTRVARLMREQGLTRVCHRRKSRLRPAAATHEDLVMRDFTVDRANRVWFTDVTGHRAADGWVYC